MNIHKLDCSPLTLIVTKRDAVMSNETTQADRCSHLLLCVIYRGFRTRHQPNLARPLESRSKSELQSTFSIRIGICVKSRQRC